MDELQDVNALERNLIKEFLDKFYDQVGYYPTVLTKRENRDEFKILTLRELEDYFNPFLPRLYGKILNLGNTTRIRPLVELRFIFFFIARQMRYTFLEIAQYIGKKDHSTVIHGVAIFRNLYETDILFRQKYQAIINIIKSNYESSTVEHLDQMEIES